MTRLYKSSTNKKLSGVCGGIGESFGFDPTILRLIFALLFVYRGIGLLLYFVLAIVLPYDYQVDRQQTKRPSSERRRRPTVSSYRPRDGQKRKDVTDSEREDRRWSDF